MSTDLYGVRVIGLEPGGCRVRLRVFVLYYDTRHLEHEPLPDDASFFLRVLCDNAGPSSALGAVVTVDRLLSEDWVDANAWQFVERFAQLATRNHPADFAGLSGCHSARSSSGRWPDEDQLVQADYDVWVTDPRWLAALRPGDSWGTTASLTEADRLRPADRRFVPDLRTTAAVRVPFATGAPAELAFAADGRHLAASSDEGALVVYDTTAWTERLRLEPSAARTGARLAWSSGGVVTLRRPGRTWAFDIGTGHETDPPDPSATEGSPTASTADGSRRFAAADPSPTDHTADGSRRFAAADPSLTDPTADGSRRFVAAGADVLVLELPSGRTVDIIAAAPGPVRAVAVHPAGRHLAVSHGFGHRARTLILRTTDHEVITSYRAGLFMAPLCWSPDGRWLAVGVHHHPAKGTGAELHIHPVGRTPVLPGR